MRTGDQYGVKRWTTRVAVVLGLVAIIVVVILAIAAPWKSDKSIAPKRGNGHSLVKYA